jgi:hypothetical protein
VFTPGRDGDAGKFAANASAEVIEEDDGTALRIVVAVSGDTSPEKCWSRSAPEVMQALAGRQSVLAISARSASSETTQIYVKCEFSVLGDCGRRRFDVTYETSDILLSLDYRPRAGTQRGGISGDQQRHIRRRQGHRPAGDPDSPGQLRRLPHSRILPTTQAKNRPFF